MTRRTLVFVLLFSFALPAFAATQGTQPKPESTPGEVTFDERDAAQVLGIIRNALESYSPSLMLSAFDGHKMPDFLTFQDEMQAYFTRYQSFRVSYHILQTSLEGTRGIILADFEIETEPREGGRNSRRKGQLRFELERAAKGWRIVEMNPRDFFF